jgi:hypothetical protein
MWQAIGTPVTGGCDAELLGQVAANPAGGIATLVDALPGLLAADWAAAIVVPADWASARSERSEPRSRERKPNPASGLAGAPPTVVYASWQTPDVLALPDVAPLRPRAFRGPERTRYGAVPFGRAGMVLLLAREVDSTVEYGAPDFHASEMERASQLVRTAALLLGDRLDLVGAT